jgi:hypothetical protein
MTQVWIAHIDPFFCAHARFLYKSDHVAFLEIDRIIFEIAYPEFWSLQITEDADMIVILLVDVEDMLYDLAVLFVRAVREIQPKDIHTCPGEVKQLTVLAAGGADGGNDLSTEVIQSSHSGKV